jgi:hypothetical protein
MASQHALAEMNSPVEPDIGGQTLSEAAVAFLPLLAAAFGDAWRARGGGSFTVPGADAVGRAYQAWERAFVELLRSGALIAFGAKDDPAAPRQWIRPEIWGYYQPFSLHRRGESAARWRGPQGRGYFFNVTVHTRSAVEEAGPHSLPKVEHAPPPLGQANGRPGNSIETYVLDKLVKRFEGRTADPSWGAGGKREKPPHRRADVAKDIFDEADGKVGGRIYALSTFEKAVKKQWLEAGRLFKRSKGKVKGKEIS